MLKILAWLTFLALLIMATPSVAEACSCLPAGPPCEEVWQSPLVFAGTVIEVDRTGSDVGPRRVRLRISESFRGTEKGEVDIHLRGGGSPSCEPSFGMGESWLVYADNRWDGGPGWTASRCSRTRLLRDASEDLAYLRLPDEKKGTSRIIGRVRHHRDQFLPTTIRTVETPVGNVPVRVKGGADTIETVTAADGSYSIDVPSHQPYEVAFGSVPGMIVRGNRTVWVPDHRACVLVDAYASDDGRVSGLVVNGNGQPVPFLPLSLKQSREASLGGITYDAISDEAGRFEFRGVRPAGYVLRASERLWPRAEAVGLESAYTTIALDPSERLDLGRAALPTSARAVLVEGIVVDQEGRAVPDVLIAIKRPDTYEALWDAVMTDARGVFRISLIAEKRYVFEASLLRPYAKGGLELKVEETIQVRDATKVRLQLVPYR